MVIRHDEFGIHPFFLPRRRQRVHVAKERSLFQIRHDRLKVTRAVSRPGRQSSAMNPYLNGGDCPICTSVKAGRWWRSSGTGAVRGRSRNSSVDRRTKHTRSSGCSRLAVETTSAVSTARFALQHRTQRRTAVAPADDASVACASRKAVWVSTNRAFFRPATVYARCRSTSNQRQQSEEVDRLNCCENAAWARSPAIRLARAKPIADSHPCL